MAQFSPDPDISDFLTQNVTVGETRAFAGEKEGDEVSEKVWNSVKFERIRASTVEPDYLLLCACLPAPPPSAL